MEVKESLSGVDGWRCCSLYYQLEIAGRATSGWRASAWIILYIRSYPRVLTFGVRTSVLLHTRAKQWLERHDLWTLTRE